MAHATQENPQFRFKSIGKNLMTQKRLGLNMVTHFASRIMFLKIHGEPSKHIPEGTSLTEMCNDESPGTNNKTVMKSK